jgi:two-component system response regulator AtoC
MPGALQVKLLRVLQEKKVRRLGGTGDIPINARIISATNRDIEGIVKEGRFREDLYYRLNVFRLNLPPLRERKDDIPLLAANLLEKLCARMGRPVPQFSDGVMEKLASYTFPGNVRELENILERSLIYCSGQVIGENDIDLHKQENAGIKSPAPETPAGRKDLSESSPPGAAKSVEASSMEDIEKQAIMNALEKCGGNRTKTAKMLGLSRKTILNKLKAWRL